LVDTLQQAITDGISNSRVEVGMLEPLVDKSQIAVAVRTIQNSPAQKWVSIGDWAQFRRIDEGQALPPMFDGTGAQVSVAGDNDVKGPGKSVVVRWEHADTRARHALERKRGQVREGVRNLVVMDVCAVGGIGDWPETIAKLPGTDFAKIGAIAFFHQGCLGPPERVRRRWRIVDNQHAALRIPERLMSDLESLDESKYYGIASKPRLAMT
jgi:hypothetical protein